MAMETEESNFKDVMKVITMCLLGVLIYFETESVVLITIVVLLYRVRGSKVKEIEWIVQSFIDVITFDVFRRLGKKYKKNRSEKKDKVADTVIIDVPNKKD